MAKSAVQTPPQVAADSPVAAPAVPAPMPAVAPNDMNRVVPTVVVLTVVVPTVNPPSGAPAGSPGSIFMPVGRLVDSTRDFRASQVDDLITVVVSESASAVSSGVTNSSRKSSANAGITSLAGPLKAASALTSLLTTTGNQQLQGTGQTSRNMTLTTTLSARVIGVTSNGTLIIEGRREIAVNSEKQAVIVRGLVRPEDLTTGNTIASTRIADLRIAVNGKGVVGDAVRRPNILYRIMLGLLPF